MVVDFVNEQHQAPVHLRQMQQLARRAIRHLKIKDPGRMTVTFVDNRKMRRLNNRFLSHDWSTDVLSFRYAAEDFKIAPSAMRHQIIGDVIIAPAQARTFAKRSHIPYTEELSRYLLHGILHWLGHEDKTKTQKQIMRVMENELLVHCRVKKP